MNPLIRRFHQLRSRMHRDVALPASITTAVLVGCLALALGGGIARGDVDGAALWSDVTETAIQATGPRLIVPDQYRTVALDLDGLRALLAGAPLERTAAAERGALELSLPLPDGSSGRFAIVESPVMAPELAERYPEIRTYAGQGLDDRTASVRLDVTPQGFHAMILAAGGSIYIDPYQRGDTTHYSSYYKHDFSAAEDLSSFEGCTVLDEDGMRQQLAQLMAEGGAPLTPSGSQLRTYRTAIAATGEYTAFHGGTVAAGMAAIVTALNRVTGVYERDVAVRMELIPNNDLIVYTNAATDPYTNGNGFTMLGQNQANLDAVIGNANYDIGHVFSTGGGGVAGLAVVCRTGQKARGVTGLSQPTGDPFYIDYVAHEMGHQYGGDHTFNGTSGSCAGNRVGSSAYEPGSGSTIMAYAGICSGQNIQGHSDDYFHVRSFDQIVLYTTASSGNNCPVVTATGNDAPLVDAGTGGFTIPIGTPFALTGSVTDPNGDDVTYCWEEYDLGPAGHPNSPSGNAPIFRSFDPVTTPMRYFPKLSDILFNFHTLGELMPTYTRNLNFRLTARDNRALGGGVDHDQITFSVSSAAGPFEVTTANTPVQWTGGTSETINWDVANTDLAPVNSHSVDILFSTNAGTAFDFVLASGTPNDGSQSVVVPNVQTFFGRIMVRAADNVFLDINNTNIQVQPSTGIDESVAAAAAGGYRLHGASPNPFNPSTSIAFELGQASRVTLTIYDTAGRAVKTLAQGRLAAGAHRAAWNGTDAAGRPVASGVYLYQLEAGPFSQTRRMVLLK